MKLTREYMLELEKHEKKCLEEAQEGNYMNLADYHSGKAEAFRFVAALLKEKD